MKVKELIEYLQKVENQESEIRVAIRQYNKVYPAAYVLINRPDYETFTRNNHEITINVSLPYDSREFMYTATKKLK